jgi:hypothetical protein
MESQHRKIMDFLYVGGTLWFAILVAVVVILLNKPRWTLILDALIVVGVVVTVIRARAKQQ